MHYSYAFGYAELGEYLESKGANPHVRNEYGMGAHEGDSVNEMLL